jgi:hypothetical protein
MSFNKRNQPFTSYRKPLCTHCKNTGEHESVYTSHYSSALADSKGNRAITCPKILNTECRYCYKLGHLRSHCPTLAAAGKEAEKSREIQQKILPKKVEKKVKFAENRGGFSILNNDSDEEISVKKLAVVEEFPALNKGAPVKSKPSLLGYAKAAASIPEPSTQKISGPISNFRIINKGDRMEKTKCLPKFKSSIPWTAESSSDEEDYRPTRQIKKMVERDPWKEDHDEFAGVSVGWGGGFMDEL